MIAVYAWANVNTAELTGLNWIQADVSYVASSAVWIGRQFGLHAHDGLCTRRWQTLPLRISQVRHPPETIWLTLIIVIATLFHTLELTAMPVNL